MGNNHNNLPHMCAIIYFSKQWTVFRDFTLIISPDNVFYTGPSAMEGWNFLLRFMDENIEGLWVWLFGPATELERWGAGTRSESSGTWFPHWLDRCSFSPCVFSLKRTAGIGNALIISQGKDVLEPSLSFLIVQTLELYHPRLTKSEYLSLSQKPVI